MLNCSTDSAAVQEEIYIVCILWNSMQEKARLTNNLAGTVSTSPGQHQSAKEKHAGKRGDSVQPKKLSGYNLYCKNRRQELQVGSSC